MKTLIIASIYDHGGKTMMALGVGKRLQMDGFKIGYMKPMGKYPSIMGGTVVDSDAAFVCSTLELNDPPEFVSPIIITQDTITRAYRGEELHLEEKIIHAHQELSRGKDVLIMGWAGTINQGNLAGVSLKKLVEHLEASIIVLYKFQADAFIDDLLPLTDLFGNRIAGVVLNQVGFPAIGRAKNYIAPFLAKKGLNVLGMFLSDPIAMSVTVRELAAILNGEVLCCEHKLDSLVKRFSVGTINIKEALEYFKEALKYFRKIKNKAVITSGNRWDVQLAALETDTRCLVLSGDIAPNDEVLAKAKEREVPIIAVKADILAVVRQVEDMMNTLKTRDEQKIRRAIELVNDELDFSLLYEHLGLNGGGSR